jgi:hypothetical protein
MRIMKVQPYTNKKTGRPGSARQKPHPTRDIILAQLSVKEGFELMNLSEREKPYLFGEAIERDWKRWNVLKSCELKCYRCNIRATHWQVEKHKNDWGRPFNLNVYSNRKMLTWDHIVPKSYGGSDEPINGRVACEPCNGNRGNDMTMQEMLWATRQDPRAIYSSKEITPWTIPLLVRDACFHGYSPQDSKAVKYGMHNPFFGASNPLEPILVIDPKSKRVTKDLSRNDYARYDQLDR